MMLRQLPDNVRSYLRSGVAVSSISQCVEELFLNAVDAGATCVAVRVDLDVFRIQVVDNGQGIAADQLEMLAERYFTSKCHLVSDLNNLIYFGYRGEALASIRESCGILEVTTRTKSSPKTYCKMFQNGHAHKVTVSTISRPSPGTTVTVHDLFSNFPVRQRSTQTALELERIKHRLEGLSLLKPHISVSLRNDLNGNIILQTHKCNDTTKTFSYLFGSEKAKSLVAVERLNAPFTLKGFIGITAHTKKDLQFVYINGRVVLKTKVHKMVNEAMGNSVIFRRSYGQNSSPSVITQTQTLSSSPTKYLDKHPFYVLDIICPFTEYDITLDPAKTLVEFKDWNKLLQCINEMVTVFLKTEKIGSDMKVKTGDRDIEAPTHRALNNRISPSHMKDTLISKRVRRQGTDDTQLQLYSTPQTVSVEEWKATNNKPETTHSTGMEGSLLTVSSGQNSFDLAATETPINTSVDNIVEQDFHPFMSCFDISLDINSVTSKPVKTKSRTYYKKCRSSSKITDHEDKSTGNKTNLHNEHYGLSESEVARDIVLPATQSLVPYSSLSMYKKAYGKCSSGNFSINKAVLITQDNMLSSLQRFRKRFNISSGGMSFGEENPLAGEEDAKQNKLKSDRKLQQSTDEGVTQISNFKLHTNLSPSSGQDLESEKQRKQVNPWQDKFRKRTVNSTDSNSSSAAKLSKLVEQTVCSVSIEPESPVKSFLCAKQISSACVRDASFMNWSYNSHVKPERGTGNALTPLHNKEMLQKACNNISGHRSFEPYKETLTSQHERCKSSSFVRDSSNVYCNRPIDSLQFTCCTDSDRYVQYTLQTDAIDIGSDMDKQKETSDVTKNDLVTRSERSSYTVINDVSVDCCSESTLAINTLHERLETNFSSEDIHLSTAVPLYRNTPGNYINSEPLLYINNEPSCNDTKNIASQIDTEPFVVSTHHFNPKTGPDDNPNNLEHCEKMYSQGFSTSELENKVDICPIPNSQGFSPHSELGNSMGLVESTDQTVDVVEKNIIQSYFNVTDITECTDTLNSKVYVDEASSELTRDTLESSSRKISNSYCANISDTQNMDDTYIMESANMIGSEEISVTQMLNRQGLLDNCSTDIPLNSPKLQSRLFFDIYLPSQNEDSCEILFRQCDKNSPLKDSSYSEKVSTGTRNDIEMNELNDCSWNSTWGSELKEGLEKDVCTSEQNFTAQQIIVNNKGSQKSPQHDVVTEPVITISQEMYSDIDAEDKIYTDSNIPSTVKSDSCILLSKANVTMMGPQSDSVRIQVANSKSQVAASSIYGHMLDQYLQEEEGVNVKWRTTAEIDQQEITGRTTLESIFIEIDDLEQYNPNKELMAGEMSGLPSCVVTNAYKSSHSCTFTKEMLQNVKVVGQLDKKFIACVLDTGKQASKAAGSSRMLVVIDQHAAHERIRLEMLTEEAHEENDGESSQLCSYTVNPPRSITFTKDEVRLMINFKEEFKRIGIKLNKDLHDQVTVWVHSVPECLVVKGNPDGKKKEDFIYWDTIEAVIKDHVELLRKSLGSKGRMPKVIHKVLCTLACHGAIKFGDALSLLECETLIKDLALCELPFQCAHGRPSLMPVLHLDQLSRNLGTQESGIAFASNKSFNKSVAGESNAGLPKYTEHVPFENGTFH